MGSSDLSPQLPVHAGAAQTTKGRLARKAAHLKLSKERGSRTRTRMAIASQLAAVALLLVVLGAHLTSCEEHMGSRRRRSPVIRSPRGVATTGCYIVAMKDDASEDELQQVASKAVKASDDAKLHGIVHKVKKVFTVKLNPYALEMVRN